MMLPKFLLDDIDMLYITYHTNGTTKIQWALPHSAVSLVWTTITYEGVLINP